eukprot:TRINITY_DN9451_c0_g2_i1.p1 TRINITY_DN9451_c0_g2~~TRINITY_DN9451_c0_g2_i1.p1  ORF type:complete len:286 (+),score=79.39 TRINITY_DN9451_c0_g2_i1:110-967(+)
MAGAAEPQTLEEALKTIRAMDMELQVLRHFSAKYNLRDLAERTEATRAAKSPEVGARVKVVHQGSKYNPKDFEKPGTFASYTGKYADTLQKGQLGVVVQKAMHFKRTDVEVFLIKFDSNEAAIMSRKGFEPLLFLGSPVSVVNQGCKYAAKDFRVRDGFSDLNITDEVRMGQTGLLVRTQPHFRAANTCYVVAVDESMKCVIMSGKGITAFEPPGLQAELDRRERERKQKAEAAAEQAAAAQGEKKKADAPPEGEPPAKMARRESPKKSPAKESPKGSPKKSSED